MPVKCLSRGLANKVDDGTRQKRKTFWGSDEKTTRSNCKQSSFPEAATAVHIKIQIVNRFQVSGLKLVQTPMLPPPRTLPPILRNIPPEGIEILKRRRKGQMNRRFREESREQCKEDQLQRDRSAWPVSIVISRGTEGLLTASEGESWQQAMFWSHCVLTRSVRITVWH